MASLDWDRAAVLDFIVKGSAWLTEELTDFTPLVDLGLNEDELRDLASDLEDEFGVELPDETALEWQTVGDVVGAVLGRGVVGHRRKRRGQA